jgi:hypothetical protein
MKEVTIKIPDKKFSFFMELFKQLGLEVAEGAEIPEEHKKAVLERMKRSEQDPNRLKDWDEVQDSFRFE